MSPELLRAAASREPVRQEDTDALRLVDGRSDGFPGVEIDDFAGHWLVQANADKPPPGLSPGEGVRSIHWKKLGDKAPPRWLAGEKLTAPFVVRESSLLYWVDFQAGCSQGLFLDQRLNRRRVRGHRRRVLNCFAYTCSFGVAAAAGGASTVNVDLSRNYLDWGKRNYLLNGLDPAAHAFLYGDMFGWLKRFGRRGEKFDLVILDPPTFSRDGGGEVFTVESRMTDLVAFSESLVSERGAILCSTNQRSIGSVRFLEMIHAGLRDRRDWDAVSAKMPPDFTGDQYLKTWWLTRK